MLNHLTLINCSFISIDEANKKTSKAVIHPDMSNSSMKKDNLAFKKCFKWFNENMNFE